MFDSFIQLYIPRRLIVLCFDMFLSDMMMTCVTYKCHNSINAIRKPSRAYSEQSSNINETG